MTRNDRDAVLRGVAMIGAVAAAGAAVGSATSIDAVLGREMVSLVDLYKGLHAAPELSGREEKTSARLAAELRSAGFTVTERVGRYENPGWTAYGVVGILSNGEGPTVMVRADMDALPVEERTDLPYASKVRAHTEEGQEVGVMHACGHDVHMTVLIGVARTLAALKGQWRGKLMLIGQPAEETVGGARAMLADGLYERFGRPDYALALHDNADLEAGKIGWCPEHALASSTSVDITVRGVGGHGSRPESTRDPIVVASQIVLSLQTIVSRENSPLDPAVVTVGSIHGGAKRNIIPDEVELRLTVRAYREEVRKRILSSIERIARGTAAAAGVPDERAPIVRVVDSEVVPATWNDPRLTDRVARAVTTTLGADQVVRVAPVMGAEDFGEFSLDGHVVPTCLFWLGAADPARIEASRTRGVPLPSLHSSQFAPLPEPTIRAGVKAMASAVLDLMQR